MADLFSQKLCIEQANRFKKDTWKRNSRLTFKRRNSKLILTKALPRAGKSFQEKHVKKK